MPEPDKRHIRRSLLDRRDLVSLALGEEKAVAMREQALKVIAFQGVVAGYHAIRREADPAPLLTALHKRGIALALPAVLDGPSMIFRRFAPGDALHTNRYGIPEPLPDAPEVIPAAIIIPLAAFDEAGHRLGYGGGYYDRTLSLPQFERARRIGYAYDFQRVARLPSEAHDVTLDFVVTETTVHRFSG